MELKLYSIRNWGEWFENNRSKTVKDLSWVAIPNRHDGEHFSAIMLHKKGAEIFSAWILLVQIASKCNPRGTLQKDNKTPHTVSSLSVKCRCPASWFEVALDYLEKNTDWLIVEDVALACQDAATVLSSSCQGGAQEGRERKEGKEVVASLSKNPSLEEVKLCVSKTGLPESDAVWFWNKCESNGWTNGGQKIKSWSHTIAAWKAAGYMPSQKKPQPEFKKSGGSSGSVIAPNTTRHETCL